MVYNGPRTPTFFHFTDRLPLESPARSPQMYQSIGLILSYIMLSFAFGIYYVLYTCLEYFFPFSPPSHSWTRLPGDSQGPGNQILLSSASSALGSPHPIYLTRSV